MLTEWQNRFPKSFKYYPELLTDSTEIQQQQLANILSVIDSADLLDDPLCLLILKQATFDIDKLTLLIKLLAEANCLTLAYIHLVFEDLSGCIDLFEQAGRADIPPSQVIACLDSVKTLRGLSRALEIFKYATITYNTEGFIHLANLLDVMANPLCQTIFDARLRSFSDYSESSDPLKRTGVADSIIFQLSTARNSEDKYQLFFDYFADFRPFPPSLKYVVELDLPDLVLSTLTVFCQSLIQNISTKQDYLQAKEIIKELRTRGGNEAIFNRVKYHIAAELEFTDWCSTYKYQGLMDDIRAVLFQPQTELADFKTELESSPGYLQMSSTQMQGVALLMPAIANQANQTTAVTDVAFIP